jgi:hypothetical protein
MTNKRTSNDNGKYGVSPLRRQSAPPPVEMTWFVVELRDQITATATAVTVTGTAATVTVTVTTETTAAAAARQ